MNELNIPYFQITSGFVLGLALGYFFKKSIKIFLFIIGGVILIIFAAAYLGIVTINEEGLLSFLNGGIDLAKETASSIKGTLLSFSAQGTSAVLGFAAGLKIG